MPEVARADMQAGWTTVSLGDVVEVINDYWDRDTTIPERLVAGEHIDEGDMRIRRWGMTDDDLIPPTFNRRFQSRDALLHSRNIGKVAQPDFGGITGEKIFILRSKDEDSLLQDLIPYLVASDHFRKYAESRWAGSTNKFLNKTPLMQYEFALPPLEEQRRIVEVLIAFERSFASLCDASDSARLTHQSACSWLGDALRKSPETQWKAIGELGDVRMGRQRSPKYQTGKHKTRYLRVANVYDGYIDTSDVLEMDFDERDYATYLLQDGDILLNEGQSRELVGRSAIFRGEVPDCCFQNTLIRFRSDVMVPEFAHTLFRHWLYTGVFAAASKQTTSIAHLGLKRFVQMKLPVLDREAQQELVAPVISLEAAFLKTHERKNQCSKMKRSFLGKALGVGTTTR